MAWGGEGREGWEGRGEGDGEKVTKKGKRREKIWSKEYITKTRRSTYLHCKLALAGLPGSDRG